jgi:hypothetical protein
MKFKEKFEAVLVKLGLIDQAKQKKLTSEDWEKIEANYKEEYKTDMNTDMAADEDISKKASDRDNALKVLNSAAPESGDSEEDEKQSPASATDLTDKVEKVVKENKDLKSKVETLSKKIEDDSPQEVKIDVGVMGMPHSDTHLFGCAESLYDRSKRWNALFVARKMEADPSDDEEAAFKAEVKSYGRSVHNRMVALHREGRLNKEGLKKVSTDVVTYTGLTGAGLGSQFVVRRQDELIARIIALPSVEDIFPTRYGVQDKELITNAFLDDFSQAYQKGEVFKGSVELKPEMGYVDDAMMKVQFESLKWIERQYIGYLNTNGSDPVKWNMIEWMVLNISTKLQMEKFQRAITGIYMAPTVGTAGHILNASTGVIYTLLRYVHEYKIYPFTDSAFADYDSTGQVMIDAVEAFVEEVREVLPSMLGKAIYLNANHKKWYANGYRTKYGVQLDFQGIGSTIQDDGTPIIWVPNMGQLKFMFVTDPGNIQKLEYLPGEMTKIQFEQRLETVLAWSVWKEGTSAAYSGKKFTTLALLQADLHANQSIFMNWPITSLLADATTCDATVNFMFKTIANGGATAITNITSAKAGVAYIIECGSATNATTIAKAGNFSDLSSAYTPTTVGDYIMVILNSAGTKFLDLERCVGGTRTINTDLQPNTTTV